MAESTYAPGPITIALPTSDRKTSFDFYTQGLGFSPVGDLADDGVPEPLQFELNPGLRLMFIPTGGFGWVTGNRTTAEPEVSECLMALPVSGRQDVDSAVERARRAGGEIVVEPGQQAWGYVGVFADPDGHLWQVLSAADEKA